MEIAALSTDLDQRANPERHATAMPTGLNVEGVAPSEAEGRCDAKSLCVRTLTFVCKYESP
jgi:hypothetical protein